MTLEKPMSEICKIVEKLGRKYYIRLELDEPFPGSFWLFLMHIEDTGFHSTICCVSTILVDDIVDRFVNHLYRAGISPSPIPPKPEQE